MSWWQRPPRPIARTGACSTAFESPAAGRRPAMKRLDRVLGIGLGILIGIGIVIVFVFYGSEGTIDAPRLNQNSTTTTNPPPDHKKPPPQPKKSKPPQPPPPADLPVSRR